MHVDDALEALCVALDEVGVPRPSPPEDLSALEELEAAIAPMRLPDDLRRFWERVDAYTLRAHVDPGIHGPDMAQTAWRMSSEEFAAYQPVALVQIAYASHQCMSAELTIDGIEGGALFEWNLVDGDFDRRFDGIGDWLEYLAQLIKTGHVLRSEGPTGPFLMVPDPDLDEDDTPPPPTPAEHPIHGSSLRVARDIAEWPAHWQRAAGLRPEDFRPRGPTHTVAALLSTPPDSVVHATIAGRVVDLMSVGAWTRVRVDDGTATIDVACPPETTLLGPRMRDWFEFDVVIDAGDRVTPADPETAAEGIDEPDDRVTAVLLARYGGPAGATAQAVRRLEPPA